MNKTDKTEVIPLQKEAIVAEYLLSKSTIHLSLVGRKAQCKL